MVQHDKIQQALMHIFMILLVLSCVLPFLLMVMASLTEEMTLTRNGYSFFPEVFSLETYRYIIRSAGTILRGYVMTIVVTVIGTVCNLVLTILFAYPLSRKDLPYRSGLSFFLFFTMLFNGGLVPTYMMYANTFHIKNTIFALIVPSLMMNAFYVIMMRSFFSSSIPDSLIEAAKLDGASERKILMSIVVPLSKPMIVTLVLMVGLGYWNDWMNGLYYVNDDNLYSIQVLLTRILRNLDMMKQNAAAGGGSVGPMPSTALRMAIAVMGVLPIMLAYPFFQKYFVKGITVGSVKG